MSSVSKTDECPTISDLFSLLDRWRHLPNYQLERRADIFFALFLPEVLKEGCGIEIRRPLIPEFPIDKNEDDRGHKQVDYFALSKNGLKGILIELKTDSASKTSASGEGQKEMLHKTVREKCLVDLIKDVIEIAQNKEGDSRQRRQKYIHLLSLLHDLNLVDFNASLYDLGFEEDSKGITKMLRDVRPARGVFENNLPLEAIYIQPERGQPDEKGHTVIDFDTFSDVVMKRFRGSEDISIVFACYLKKWAKEKQAPGSVNPRAWHT